MKTLALALAVAFAVPPCWAATTGTGKSQPAGQQAAPQNPGVAPIYSRPSGKAYSDWAANWWQWALQTPANGHPAGDGDCSNGQTGKLWFLGVNFPGNGIPVERPLCVVPSGTALFVQLISSALFAFATDPPEQRTEEFLRNFVECSNFQAQSVRINGTEIRNPEQYVERSALFDVQLPADNFFGLPAMLLSPSVDMGYYLYVRPLPVGTHQISWQVSMDCPNQGGTLYQNQTLPIRVVPAGR